MYCGVFIVVFILCTIQIEITCFTIVCNGIFQTLIWSGISNHRYQVAARRCPMLFLAELLRNEERRRKVYIMLSHHGSCLGVVVRGHYSK